MKIRVAVVYGGRSTEHEISIISAVQAMRAFDTERYEVIPVYMTKENLSYTGDLLRDISSFQGDIARMLAGAVQVDFIREGNRVLLMRHERKRFGENVISEVDVVFPVVHGTNVEDGTLTGFFATLRLPVVGCDVLSGAVGMNKAVMKAVCKAHDIPVLDCRTYGWKDYEDEENLMNEIESSFSYPVIVKPVNLGSSIGISRADNRKELEEALSLAFSFAKRILVERAITRLKEVNCAVLGDEEEAEASECESPLGADEILSFEDKYMSGAKGATKGQKGVKGTVPAKGAKSGASGAKGAGMASLTRKLPADITPEKREEIRALAVRAFRVLGCAGVARIDFMIDKEDDDRVYLNEINTVPGSLSFYLWEPAGVSYRELIDRMIEIALKKERQEEQILYSFDTNVLAGVRL
ncbi:MAG: D-alanine--D-alanine ligase [Lachnospiraceae bacterium]|nr:D-alanine--D-alanine ligase [Lachnospiraceae bacterium]